MARIIHNTDQAIWQGPPPDEIRARIEAAGPSAEHWQRFRILRADLFQWIAKELAEDGHCKSYEGAFEVHMPNFFEERAAQDDYGWFDGEAWSIELHCYLLGPNRHYRWKGKNFEQALHKTETDIRAWMSGDYSLRHDEQ